MGVILSFGDKSSQLLWVTNSWPFLSYRLLYMVRMLFTPYYFLFLKLKKILFLKLKKIRHNFLLVLNITAIGNCRILYKIMPLSREWKVANMIFHMWMKGLKRNCQNECFWQQNFQNFYCQQTQVMISAHVVDWHSYSPLLGCLCETLLNSFWVFRRREIICCAARMALETETSVNLALIWYYHMIRWICSLH